MSSSVGGDMSELTESERDFRLKVCGEHHEHVAQVDDDEERRRLDELLTQCHDYIYSCHHGNWRYVALVVVL